MPSIDSISESEDDNDYMQAQGGAKARKPAGSKTVGGQTDKEAEALAKANAGKSKIQIKIERSLAVDHLVLELSSQKLQNLSDLQKMPALV